MSWQAYTLATCRTLLQDKWEGVPFWTNEEARTSLNEALRIWNLLTGMWKRRVTIQTQAGIPWIAVPSTMVYDTRVSYQGQSPLSLSSIADLDNLRQGWVGETTASGGEVPTSPKLWAPKGLSLLAIWPADAAGGHSLVVDGVRQTPTLVNDGDFFDAGAHELEAILGMALHVAAFKLGSPLFDGTQKFYSQFITAAGDQNSRLKASSFYRKVMGLDKDRAQRPMRKALAGGGA